MKYFALLFALTMALAHSDTGNNCPVPVTIDQILLVYKTPVYLSASYCRETTLVIGTSTIPITDVPTFVKSRFEIANTMTATSTIDPSQTIQYQAEDTKAESHHEFNIIRPGENGEADTKPDLTSPANQQLDNHPGGVVSIIYPAIDGNNPPAFGPRPPGENPQPQLNIDETGQSSADEQPTQTIGEPEQTITVTSPETITRPSTSNLVTSQGSSSAQESTDSVPNDTSSTSHSSDDSSSTTPSSEGQLSTSDITPSTTVTSTEECVITATPVSECCINELPEGCKPMWTTNGEDLKPVIQACEKAIGKYLTEDMAECWEGEVTEDSRGENIADCLLYELENCCITELPKECKDLRGARGSDITAGAAKCRDVLGLFVHGTAAPCLDEERVSTATRGESLVDCLEVAYGFRSGPVTISDPEVCPRTSGVA